MPKNKPPVLVRNETMIHKIRLKNFRPDRSPNVLRWLDDKEKWFPENRQVAANILTSPDFRRGTVYKGISDFLFAKGGVGSRKGKTRRTKMRKRYYGANRGPRKK